jgi:hypothetical protein
MRIRKKEHWIALLVWPIIATLLTLILRANYLSSQLLFWGVPAILLTFWATRSSAKAALCSLIATAFGIACNLIFYLNGQWYVLSTVFHSRLLGLMAWEDILYFFLFFYVPILAWEHFFERQTPEPLWGRRMRLLGILFTLFCLVVALAWVWVPGMLLIPYFYLIVTVALFVAPLTLTLYYHPKLGPKFIRIGAYFAYLALLFEVTSIALGQWNYPSVQFIGWVELFGQRFPFEEFVTWILIGAPGVITWYEYFDDDNR